MRNQFYSSSGMQGEGQRGWARLCNIPGPFGRDIQIPYHYCFDLDPSLPYIDNTEQQAGFSNPTQTGQQPQSQFGYANPGQNGQQPQSQFGYANTAQMGQQLLPQFGNSTQTGQNIQSQFGYANSAQMGQQQFGNQIQPGQQLQSQMGYVNPAQMGQRQQSQPQFGNQIQPGQQRLSQFGYANSAQMGQQLQPQFGNQNQSGQQQLQTQFGYANPAQMGQQSQPQFGNPTQIGQQELQSQFGNGNPIQTGQQQLQSQFGNGNPTQPGQQLQSQFGYANPAQMGQQLQQQFVNPAQNGQQQLQTQFGNENTAQISQESQLQSGNSNQPKHCKQLTIRFGPNADPIDKQLESRLDIPNPSQMGQQPQSQLDNNGNPTETSQLPQFGQPQQSELGTANSFQMALGKMNPESQFRSENQNPAQTDQQQLQTQLGYQSVPQTDQQLQSRLGNFNVAQINQQFQSQFGNQNAVQSDPQQQQTQFGYPYPNQSQVGQPSASTFTDATSPGNAAKQPVASEQSNDCNKLQPNRKTQTRRYMQRLCEIKAASGRHDTQLYLCRNNMNGLSAAGPVGPTKTPTVNKGCNKAAAPTKAKLTRRANAAPACSVNKPANLLQGNQPLTICPAYFKPCYGFGDIREVQSFFAAQRQPASEPTESNKKPLPGKRVRGRGRGKKDEINGSDFVLDEENWVKVCCYSPADISKNGKPNGKGKNGEPKVPVKPKWQD